MLLTVVVTVQRWYKDPRLLEVALFVVILEARVNLVFHVACRYFGARQVRHVLRAARGTRRRRR